jgi:plastocyanin
MAQAARVLALVMGAFVVLAGCGQSAIEPVQNRTIGLRLDEYRIIPQRVSAPAGPLRLIIRNLGILTHNVAVETIEPPGSDKAEVEIVRTETVHPGHRAEVSFTIAPGTYRLVCTIANHDDLGQTGKLYVK